MGLGLSDFRVRLFADCAKLQVKEAQIPLLLQHREDILAVLRTAMTGSSWIWRCADGCP